MKSGYWPGRTSSDISREISLLRVYERFCILTLPLSPCLGPNIVRSNPEPESGKKSPSSYDFTMGSLVATTPGLPDFSKPLIFDLSNIKPNKTIDIGKNATGASAAPFGSVRSIRESTYMTVSFL